MAVDYSLSMFFNFYNGKNLDTPTNWEYTYFTPTNTFLRNEIKINSNGFNNSFFKLDYYDTPFNKSQKIYLTTILQASNGVKSEDTIIPKYYLDFTENTEGFYFYWLKDKEILNIDTFYVSVTFFNGKTGKISRMATKCQGVLPANNKYSLNEVFDFYYKIELDYITKTYKYFDIKEGKQVGVKDNPMVWYEYITKN